GLLAFGINAILEILSEAFILGFPSDRAYGRLCRFYNLRVYGRGLHRIALDCASPFSHGCDNESTASCPNDGASSPSRFLTGDYRSN
ncbi:unnamed protein product, partial [Ilex paraguariensis]